MITIWDDGVGSRKHSKKRIRVNEEKGDEDFKVNPSNNIEPIYGCIVDDHCDIVPFLHAVYRHRKVPIPDHQVLVLHIDSHPDFSIPSAQTYNTGFQDWADKSELYEILSEDGGISEFLLPLMQQQLIKQLIWLRGEQCQQLPDGRSIFHMFEHAPNTNNTNKTRVSVDWRKPYYIDEDTYAEMKDEEKASSVEIDFITMTCKNRLKLDPSSCLLEIEKETEPTKPEAVSTTFHKPTSWILDICLDYFFVQNPFFTSLEELLMKEQIPLSIEEAIFVIVQTIHHLPYRNPSISGDVYELKERCLDVLHSFLDLPSDEAAVINLKEVMNDSLLPVSDLEKFVQITRCLSKASRDFILEKKTLLLLPHEAQLDESRVKTRIEQAKVFIKDFITLMHTSYGVACPLCITIARSLSDGYTPTALAQTIETHVIQMVKDVLLELGCTKELCLHDIAEDPIEQSYTLFLSKAVVDAYVTTGA